MILLFDFEFSVLFWHLETSWKFAGRIYANSSEYTCCKRWLSSCWWVSRRTYLQGKSSFIYYGLIALGMCILMDKLHLFTHWFSTLIDQASAFALVRLMMIMLLPMLLRSTTNPGFCLSFSERGPHKIVRVTASNIPFVFFLQWCSSFYCLE